MPSMTYLIRAPDSPSSERLHRRPLRTTQTIPMERTVRHTLLIHEKFRVWLICSDTPVDAACYTVP
jgi:hypothetical protein